MITHCIVRQPLSTAEADAVRDVILTLRYKPRFTILFKAKNQLFKCAALRTKTYGVHIHTRSQSFYIALACISTNR